MKCLVCDEQTPNMFRLSVGAILYEEDKNYEIEFIVEPFQDSDLHKFMCPQCAEQSGIFIDELDKELCCIQDDTGQLCLVPFTAAPGESADEILRIEWGDISEFQKGPSCKRAIFHPVKGYIALVHLGCAVAHWGLNSLCNPGE